MIIPSQQQRTAQNILISQARAQGISDEVLPKITWLMVDEREVRQLSHSQCEIVMMALSRFGCVTIEDKREFLIDRFAA